jgi:NADH:ubiquinone oxidoreductase subunit 5 (subunit L)/multisubunit Na+/H+ antiporter MnhA subunit
MLLLLASGTFDLLIGGWELVGITSVMLIAFFQDRPGPASSATHVYSMYKIGDLGLLLGVFVVHYAAGTSECARLLRGVWPLQTTALPTATDTLTGLLFLFAAAAKSAQFPFSGWLPRAMEGPTPSSAIFYGALSVHAGAYLLLRVEPILLASPIASTAVIAIGAISALLGTLAHRVAPDAKTSIAYAAMTQLGIIFIEIGLGFPRLALAHIIGHAIVRTLQFLRAPSMLHDYHRVHAAAGGHLAPTGEGLIHALPAPARLWLYRFGLDRGFYDAVADRLVVAPMMSLSRWLASFEPGPDTPPAPPTAAPLPTAQQALAVREKN